MDLASELARYGPDATYSPPSLAEAQAYCRRLAHTHYENFTVASRLFPRHLRQHLCHVYAYCRWADDLADEAGQLVRRGSPELLVGRGSPDPALVGRGSPDPARSDDRRSPELARDLRSPITAGSGDPRRTEQISAGSGDPRQTALALLEWWQRELDACFAGHVQHPVFVALAETIRQFDLPKEPLADLLVAFRRDQTQTRYETFDDLLGYCRYSANPVGRIVLHLGRSADEVNAGLADWICTGLQVANFCQDVARDWKQGRIYLPQTECRAAGWDEAKFAAGRCDDAFRGLLQRQVERAERRLLDGEPLCGRVQRDLRLPVRLFIDGGLAILAAIRRARYDVWSRRPTVGGWTKLRLLMSAWWRG